jgi:uncharacterized membrane protein
MKRLPVRYLLPGVLVWLVFNCLFGAIFGVKRNPSLADVGFYVAIMIVVLVIFFEFCHRFERRKNKNSD